MSTTPTTTTTSHPAPSFLALPAEIRNKIYAYLLSPSPSVPKTLYHDRHGRQPHFSLHPALLSTCRQIHLEASPFLYDHNIFLISYISAVVQQCTGGCYPDHITDPPPLLRDDEFTYQPFSRGWLEVEEEDDENSQSKEVQFPHGIIYPHVLQRLKNVELHTSPSAIWGSAMMGDYPSHIGPMLLKIFGILGGGEEQSLGNAPPLPSKKQLKVEIVVSWKGGAIFSAGLDDSKPWIPRSRVPRGGRAKDRQGADINERLVEAVVEVSKVRNVEVVENEKRVDLEKLS
ncbi:MAG: hypothetical protein Q9227_000925 [Pyrenula ochraceoflavens]